MRGSFATAVLLAQGVAAFPGFHSFAGLLHRQTKAPKAPAKPWGFFVNNTIYQPVGNESLTYPRFAELLDGTILATSPLGGRRPGSGPAAFPIFESKDGGASWKWISNITDQVNGWGLGSQPALAELTEPLGGYPNGTILASGNSASRNGTHIDLYASLDKGKTWSFVSNVAKGGRPNVTNGADPICTFPSHIVGRRKALTVNSRGALPAVRPPRAAAVPLYLERNTNWVAGCTTTRWCATTAISEIASTGKSSHTRSPRT